MAEPRHAVYFAPPPAHPLWHAGCAWLGRDDDGIGAGAPARDGVAAPWRYGFHATLKAPMRLAGDEAAWHAVLQRFAEALHPFEMPPLQVGALGNFVALRPRAPLAETHPLRRLADACVVELDRWRAPPTAAELERRPAQATDAAQRARVERYGYAHVLAHWRFHMTLSDGLAQHDPVRFAALRAEAERHFADALAVPLACDALCLFVEPAPGAPFALRARFPLGR